MNHNHYLLTGASGFLGSIIYTGLTLKGFKVIKFTGDITSTITLNKSLAVDVIIHAAGKAHFVPRTPGEQKIFYDVNFEGTKNLCVALEKLNAKPKSFIFISTVAVYGLDSGIMISEDHALNGKTPYAKSKAMAEEYLRNWASKNNIILGILRLPLVAGINAPGNLGDMTKAISNGKYFSIGKASARKSMVWSEDIPTIIPALAKTGGVFNLTDKIHPTFKQLELIIAKKNNKSIKTIPLFIARLLALTGDLLGSRFPINSNKLRKITSSLTFDDEKASKALNWKPSSVLEKLSKAL